jgi:two-component system OmpR family sensor kinase
MRRQLRSLRVRLAVTGFVAIYLPTLVLLAVVSVSESIEASSSTDAPPLETPGTGLPLAESTDVGDGSLVREVTTVAAWALATTVLLAPVSGALAWWWSGRAIRPVKEAVALQEHLIEEASHELRNPLSILSTNADVLLTHPEPTAEIYRKGLQRSSVVAARMAATIDALLVDARGRARTVERRPADLGDLARGVADVLTPVAAHRDLVLRVVAPRPVPGRVDRPSVERALTNLLTNAIAHAPEGSTVEVVVTAVGAAAEITVTDQGPGIAPAEQAKIFERYWQAGPGPGDGTGLGLAIVRQIAAAHGGSITVRSPVAGTTGTQFLLRLTR